MSSERVILGISGYLGHDSGAAILCGGSVVASSQEERYSRIKHDHAFPEKSIESCLRQAGLDYDDVTDVVFSEKPYVCHAFKLFGRGGSRIVNSWNDKLPSEWISPFHRAARKLFPEPRFHCVRHHDTHITASRLLSGWEEALFICVDGKGESYCASIGVTSSGQNRVIEEHAYENGLGMFYSIVTQYLGFLSFGSEYKVMGLSAYGEPRYVKELSALFDTDDAGRFRLKSSHRWERLDGMKELRDVLGFERRLPDGELEQKFQDVAASLQHIFETELFKLARYVRGHHSRSYPLIFTGGCAQNSLAAGKLHASGLFEDVFASPIASDAASALGAAVHWAEAQQIKIDVDSFRTIQTGPEAGRMPDEAERFIQSYEYSVHQKVAILLAAGETVGWVRGRMELGPRALGARSVLANPCGSDAKQHLNRKIKFRESFRPFAPAVLEHRAAEWFEFSGRADYMNLTAQARAVAPEPNRDGESVESRVPAVVHVDGSTRLQTVRRELQPDFYDLIEAFDALTGVPMIINTSFNLAGEPIVCTAADAWKTFCRSGLDWLVVGDQLYRHPGSEESG